MRLALNRFLDDPRHEFASVIDDPRQLAIRHSHDYYELFLVGRGGATHEVNGASLPLVRGSAVFVRPDDDHGYSGMSQNFQIINVLVPGPTIDALLRYLGEDFEPRRLLDPLLPPTVILSPGAFKAVVSELEQLVFSERILKHKSESLFRTVLLRLMVSCFPAQPESGKTEMPAWFRNLALEMMKKESFAEGLPAMYRLSGKSEEHLSRSCRRFLHKTPTEFINELRVDFATRALQLSSQTVVEICAEAGFESLSHFYHLFKKKHGIAPNAYRTGKRDPAAETLEGGIAEASLRRGISIREGREKDGGTPRNTAQA
ncbi:MAG: helix-turn-helix domain-containing protein [Spirochaetota bacterium]